MAERFAGLSLGVDISSLREATKALKEFKGASQTATESAGELSKAESRVSGSAKEHERALKQAQKQIQQIQRTIDPTVSRYKKLETALKSIQGLSDKGLINAEETRRLAQILDTQSQKLERSKLMLTEEGRASIAAAKEKEKAERATKRFVESLERQTKAATLSRAEFAQWRATQVGATKEAAPFIAKLKEQDAELERQMQSMKLAGLSAKQYGQALRFLPMQLTDVVTSLASGMPLWLIAIQQGGQIKDSFGGVKNTFRALLSVLTPLKVGVAGVVGVLGSMAYFAYRNKKANEDMAKALGEVEGMSIKQSKALAEVAASYARVAGVSKEEVVSAFTKVGESSATAIKQLVDLGMSYDEAAKLARKYFDVGDNSKLREELAEQLKIQAELKKGWTDVLQEKLAAMGSVLIGDTEGTKYAGKKDTRRKSPLEMQLEILGQFNKENEEAAKNRSKEMADLGASLEKEFYQTNRIANANRELLDLQAKLNKAKSLGDKTQIDQANYLVDAKKKEIQKLKGTESKQKKTPIVRGATEQLDKELYVLQAQLKTLKEHKGEYDVISSQRRALWSVEKQIEVLEEAQSKRRLTGAEKKLLEEQKSVLELSRQKAELGDQIKIQEKLNELKDKSNKYVMQQRQEMAALIQTQSMSERAARRESEIASLRTEYAASQEEMNRAINARKAYYAAEDAMRLNWLSGISSSWAEFGDEATNAYESVKEIGLSAMNGLSDQLSTFLTEGKANFKDFARSIINMIVQMITKMAIFNAMSGMMGGKGSFVMSDLFSGFGRSAPAPAMAMAAPAMAMAGGAMSAFAAPKSREAPQTFSGAMRTMANVSSGSINAAQSVAASSGGVNLNVGAISVDVNNGNDPRGLESGVKLIISEEMAKMCGQGGRITNFINEKMGRG